jgi:hypothetical protein
METAPPHPPNSNFKLPMGRPPKYNSCTDRLERLRLLWKKFEWAVEISAGIIPKLADRDR